jgi:nicotinamidase-related amidase
MNEQLNWLYGPQGWLIIHACKNVDHNKGDGIKMNNHQKWMNCIKSHMVLGMKLSPPYVNLCPKHCPCGKWYKWLHHEMENFKIKKWENLKYKVCFPKMKILNELKNL